MSRAKKNQNTDWQQRIAEETRREKEIQAENRRRLLATLDPKTAEMTRREFARLGLDQ
jgi:hypothetical protein